MRKKEIQRLRVRILFWFAWNVVRLLPYGLAADLLAFFARRFAPYLTRQAVIRDNLKACFPEQGREWIDQTAIHAASNLGRISAELCHLSYLKKKATFTVTGGDQFTLTDRPYIFVGAHLGNWELVPLYLTRMGVDLTIIYLSFGSHFIDEQLLSARRTTGAAYFSKKDALLALAKAMKRGGSIALLVDQKVPTGLEVQFFGRPTIITLLPARLSRKYDAPIVPVDIERKSKFHFHIDFGPAILPIMDNVKRDERDLTQEMAYRIEQTIKRAPQYWFCNTRRWPNRVLE